MKRVLHLVAFLLAALCGARGDDAAPKPFVARNERTVRALAGDLGHENRDVRAEAAWALGLLRRDDLADRVLLLLGETEPPVARLAAAEALGRMGATAAAPRLAAIAASDASPELRAEAVTALAALKGPAAGDALRQAAQDPDPIIRMRAARLLAGVDADPGPLLALLSDGDDPVRRRALLSLARLWAGQRGKPIAGADATAAKLAAMLDDPEPMIRAGACDALGELRVNTTALKLIERLGDAHYLVRRQAARALGVQAATAAGPTLIARLGDGDYTVRVAAAWALGEIRPRAGIVPLADRLEDRWPEVRDAAKHALVKHDVTQALAAVSEKLLHSPRVEARRRAAWVLAEWGDPSVGDAAAEGIKDQDVVVRAEALRALRRAGDRRAVPHALKVLAWERRWVRDYTEIEEAYQVAAQFKDPEFVPLIMRRLELAPRWSALSMGQTPPPADGRDVAAALLAAGHFKRPEMTALIRRAVGDLAMGGLAEQALAIAEGREYVPPSAGPKAPGVKTFYVTCFDEKKGR